MTGFNLLRKLADIGLAQVVADIMQAYQEWVHFPVQWLFGWLHLAPPPDWTIDVALLWLLIGGIVLRSAWPIRIGALRAGKWVNTSFDMWDTLLEKRWALLPFIGFCLLIWPLAAYFLVSEPYFYSTSESSFAPSSHRMDRHWTFLYDLRTVLSAQALAALASVAAWVVVNVLLKLYQ